MPRTGKLAAIPGSLIFAAETSQFIVWPKSHALIRRVWAGQVRPDERPISARLLTLHQGDILIFRAETVHSGAGYSSWNVRALCYYTLHGDELVGNEAFPIAKGPATVSQLFLPLVRRLDSDETDARHVGLAARRAHVCARKQNQRTRIDVLNGMKKRKGPPGAQHGRAAPAVRPSQAAGTRE